jgi:cell division septation protein DedD
MVLMKSTNFAFQIKKKHTPFTKPTSIMAKLIINSGKGNLLLTKSSKFVGIKTNEKNLSNSPNIGSKKYEHLAGFKVMTLAREKGKKANTQLDEIRALDEVSVGTHVYHAAGSDLPIVPNGEIYIVFEKNISNKRQLTLLKPYHVELIERRAEHIIIVKVTAESPNPFKVAMALQKKKEVKSAEPDFDTLLDHYAFSMPQDTLMSHAWHLRNNGVIPDNPMPLKKGADAKVIDAWQRLDSMGSSAITIAVIDNGFDLAHRDFQGKIVNQWDNWSNSSNLLQGDTRFTHGTPCAGVAISAANGFGMVGVAPNARFMPISGTTFEDRGTEDMFNYAMRNGADIISCSWGSVESQNTLSPRKEAAISNAARNGRNGKGCIILYAAGNEGMSFVNYYAAHPDVICVAASTSDDSHPDYSNQGNPVWVAAPSNGEWPITAARAWWDEGNPNEVDGFKFWADGVSRGDNYKHFGGTSSATPLVAGICALILSANPNLTAREVKDILAKTADKIGGAGEYDNTGHSVKFGYGRVNALRAVEEAIRRKGGTVQPNTPTPANNNTTTPTKPVTPTTPTTKPVINTTPFKAANLQYPSGGFGIQTGTYSNPGNVLVQVQNMEITFKVPVFVYIGKDKFYRVVVGTFGDVASANKLLQQMKAKNVNGIVKDHSVLKNA